MLKHHRTLSGDLQTTNSYVISAEYSGRESAADSLLEGSKQSDVLAKGRLRFSLKALSACSEIIKAREDCVGKKMPISKAESV